MINLRKTLEENKDIYIKHLKELIEIDTHDIGHGIEGGLEKKGQEYLEKLFKEMNADSIVLDPLEESSIQKSIQLYNEGNPGHNYDSRYNLYAKFSGKGKRKLLFNGHVDVMPANPDEWSTDPFKSVIKERKMFGRGTADMKGGLMASIMAVQLIKDAGIDLPGEVIITSVCDEEGGGNGSIQAVMTGIETDGVVVCEPTDDNLILAHMGFIFFKVEFKGIACHSGTKWDGVSAIDKAIKFIDALNEKEMEWLGKYNHPLLPSPNLNVGVIKGGSAGSTVPSSCEISICVHYLPEQMNHNQVVKEFEEVVDRTCERDEFLVNNRPIVSIYQAGGGFLMNEDDKLVDSFKDAYKHVRQKNVVVAGSPAGCDSRLWRNIAKRPTIQFGPGNLAQCHAVDEWIMLDSYLNAILTYAKLILNYLE